MEIISSEKRIKIVTFIIGLFTFGLIVKLFYISTVQHGHYLAMAENQYIFKKEVPAERGKIYLSDKNVSVDDFSLNYPVAVNIEKFDVSVIPRNIKNPQDVAEKLASILSMPKEKIFDQINNQKPYLPPIAKMISKSNADKIKELKIQGVFLTSNSSRFYTESSLASQVIGFVNSEGKGQYGVEGEYNDVLCGKSGEMVGSKDTKGRMINVGDVQNSVNGSGILLTIDRNIQFMAEQKLGEGLEKYGAESGSIIVMDPKTGAVLAMANKPDYNLNEFSKVAEEKNDYLFKNPSVSSLYEPGSTFKSMVMAGAIEKGLVSPETEEVFGKSIQIGSYEIGTAEDKAFGRETMTDVLVHSDNVAMVWLGDKMGNDMLYDYIKNFGFGEKTNIDLGGEESGVVRDKQKWRDINRATYTFGQGISVTPIQLITAYGALANGGKLMQPYVVRAIKDQGGVIKTTQPKEVRRVVSEETAAKLSTMMVEVVDRGTGHHAKVEGYKIAGKTGTAQVPNPEGGYFGDDIKIGSLAGYAPASDPKFVMLVKIDKPKLAQWGETSAGPIFGEMDRWLLNYFELRPSEKIEN